MKILFIDINLDEVQDNNQESYGFNINLLKTLAEIQDIRKEVSFDGALNYINEYLITDKKYLDFILICVNSTYGDKANDFAQLIRRNKETYFHGYFNISALCIIVITEFTFHDNVIKNELFSKILYSYSNEAHFITELGNTIIDWRQKLAGELDDLNLKPTIEFKNFDPDWAVRYKLHRLKILTSKFIAERSNFSFIWLGDNLKLIDYSVNEFQQLIKSRNRYKEKHIHQYLKRNERFLLGEYKSHYSYEKQLYYRDSRKYIEIDFINHSYSYISDSPEAFEIKRPEKELLHKNKIGFYSHFNQYLNQLTKYHLYLSDKNNVSQIKKKLDIEHQPFDYTILLSRREFVEEYKYLIEPYISSQPFQMKLITYDDLINRFERFYDRTKKYGIR